MTPNNFIYWKEPGHDEIYTIDKPLAKKIITPVIPNSGFLFFPFETRKTGLVIEGNIEVKNNLELPVVKGGSHKKKNTGKEEYISLVNSAIDRISGGHFEKVVLARSFTQGIPASLSLVDYFLKLCHNYPGAFIYCIGFEGETWIGASPEIFLKKDGNRFLTYALAGTRQEDLNTAFGPKEMSEQALVRNYILGLLKSEGASSIEISALSELNTGNLTHLVNEIRFSIDQPEALILKLHPTPAVCGFPLQNSLKFITQYENLDRSYYSGFLGPVKGISDISLWVNLRCARIFGNTITFYAGAGIVADSNAEAEWHETEKKMDTLRALFPD